MNEKIACHCTPGCAFRLPLVPKCAEIEADWPRCQSALVVDAGAGLPCQHEGCRPESSHRSRAHRPDGLLLPGPAAAEQGTRCGCTSSGTASRRSNVARTGRAAVGVRPAADAGGRRAGASGSASGWRRTASTSSTSSPLQRAYNTGMAIARITGHRDRRHRRPAGDQRAAEGGRRRTDPERAAARGVTHRDIKAKFEADPIWDNLPGSEIERALPRAHRARRSTRSSQRTRARRWRSPATAASSSRTSRTSSGLRSDFPFYCFNASITSVRAQDDRRALWRLNDLGHLDGMPMT